MAANSNAKQHIPELFHVIMEVDNLLFELRAATVPDLPKIIDLKKRKAELRKAAEIALAWNHNKGNVG